MAKATGKFVVLFGQVAHDHYRGDVISEADLGNLDSELQRYLDLGALRPATEAEAKLQKVTLESARPRLAQSVDQKASEQAQEIERLRARIKELEGQGSDKARRSRKADAQPEAAAVPVGFVGGAAIPPA